MIPKIIHYCWLGGKPKPASVLRCIKSWEKYCPDYKIIEWNENNLDIEHAPSFAREAYEAAAWGFVPDYYRLWIIYTYGGIYLDTDVQVIRALDPLLKETAFAGFEGPNHVALGLGFGAEPHDKMIFEHMMLYNSLHFLNEDGTQNRIPSPVITTEWLLTKGLQLGTNRIQTIGSFRLFPKEYFAPKDFNTGMTEVTENTFSIHQYDSSWFSEEEMIAHNRSLAKFRFDRVRYAPNRIARQLLGDERYEEIKKKVLQLMQ